MKINFFALPMLAAISTATDLKHLAPSMNSGTDLSQTYWDQVDPISNLAQQSMPHPPESSQYTRWRNQIKSHQRYIDYEKAKIKKEKAGSNQADLIKQYESSIEYYSGNICKFEKQLAKLYVSDGRDYIGSPECGSSMNADGTVPKVTAPLKKTPEVKEAEQANEAAGATAAESERKLAAAKAKYQEMKTTGTASTEALAAQKAKYRALQTKAASDAQAASDAIEALKRLHAQQLRDKDAVAAADANRFREEADAKAKARVEKAARDKIIEDAEDETERQRAAADNKKYVDLQARAASQAAKSKEAAEEQSRLAAKALKAEKDGRSADAQRYRDEATRKAQERANQIARDKITEDEEDEQERWRAARDKKKHDDLKAIGTRDAEASAAEMASIRKKCEADTKKGAEYKKMYTELKAKADKELLKAQHDMERALDLKTKYTTLKNQAATNVKRTAAEAAKAEKDAQEAADLRSQYEQAQTQILQDYHRTEIDLHSAEKLKRDAQKALYAAQDKNHDGLRNMNQTQKKEVKELEKGIKAGHDAAITSLVSGGLGAMIGMASLMNEHVTQPFI